MTRFTGRPAVTTCSLLTLLSLCAAPLSAQADPVADFYKGKTITLIVGTSAGNDYDFRGRLLARHLGRHIPGKPTIIRAEHAGRRRHQGGELPRQHRAARRHRGARDHDQHDGVAGDGNSRHRVRHAQVLLDRQHHLARRT